MFIHRIRTAEGERQFPFLLFLVLSILLFSIDIRYSCAETNPWKSIASSQISPGPGMSSTIKTNHLITRAYAQLYLENPNRFKWAGLAMFASSLAGNRIFYAYEAYAILGAFNESLLTTILDQTIGISADNRSLTDKLFQALTGKQINVNLAEGIVQSITGISGQYNFLVAAQLLAEGNLLVYKDLYWQHLAYKHCGIAELEKLLAGEAVLEAWRQIEQGKSDPNKTWTGTTELARREQQVVLQPVFNKAPALWQAIRFIKSPIPETLSFDEFTPAGNFGRFEDRWQWALNVILPAWRNFEQEGKANSWMQETVNEVNREFGIARPPVPQSCSSSSQDVIPPAAPSNVTP